MAIAAIQDDRKHIKVEYWKFWNLGDKSVSYGPIGTMTTSL